MNLTNGTASTQGAQFLTVADIEKAERKFQANEWFLVSPTGVMYKGSPLELLQVLLPFHPLLKGLYEHIPRAERESEGKAPGASAGTGEDSSRKEV